MIGADTAMVQAISTSICTCCTSLVLRVISDGAPNSCTSRFEKVPTRLEQRGAQVAAEAHRRCAAPNQTAVTEHDDLDQRDREHHRRRCA